MAGGRAGKKNKQADPGTECFGLSIFQQVKCWKQRGLNTKQGWKMGSLCAIKYTQERMMWGCGVVCYKGLLVDCLRLTARRKTWDLVCGGGNPCCGYGLTIVPTWWLFSTVGLVLFWQPEGLDYMGSCSSVSSLQSWWQVMIISFHSVYLFIQHIFFDAFFILMVW